VGKAVIVAVAVGGVVGDAIVAVEVGVAVAVGVAVDVGGVVPVGVIVAVKVGVAGFVTVGKMIETGVSVAVAVGKGVRVMGIFGTRRICPTLRLYWKAGMQLANWSCGMLTP